MLLARNYYNAYNEALDTLYVDETIQLKGSDETDLFSFSEDIINDAIKALHKKGSFSSDMLNEKEGIALISENFRILSDAVKNGMADYRKERIDSGINTEIPTELTSALRDNAFVFSGFKAYHTLNEAGISLMDQKGGIKSFDEFKKDAGEIFKKQGLNLRSEYQHAVQTAQMAARWADIEADGDRYDLQYRTVGDNKVRPQHAALNNTTLPPSNAFWNDFYPPNGWGCRCTVIQVRKGKYNQSNAQDAIEAGMACTAKDNQKMFRTNAGKTQKLFPDKHPNLPKGCGGCDNKIKLAYGKGKPECSACKIISELHFNTAKKTREWAKTNIQGKEVTHPDIDEKILISGGGIKEFSNQPHKYYYEKNKLLHNIEEVIKNSEFKGITHHKGRDTLVFEVMIKESKNWILANRGVGMGINLYSITESDAVLKDIKK